MATIVKNTKIYCNADSPISTIDGGELKNNLAFGSEGRNSQSYYGEDENGENKIFELLWQPGDLFGFTTGRTYIDTKAKTLYYEFRMDSSFRVNATLFNFGAGSYQAIIRSAWVSSEFVTDDQNSSLEKFDRRTDTKTVTEVKTNNNANKSGASVVATSSSSVPATPKNNTIIYLIGAGFLGLVAFLAFGRKK